VVSGEAVPVGTSCKLQITKYKIQTNHKLQITNYNKAAPFGQIYDACGETFATGKPGNPRNPLSREKLDWHLFPPKYPVAVDKKNELSYSKYEDKKC